MARARIEQVATVACGRDAPFRPYRPSPALGTRPDSTRADSIPTGVEWPSRYLVTSGRPDHDCEGPPHASRTPARRTDASALPRLCPAAPDDPRRFAPRESHRLSR